MVAPPPGPPPAAYPGSPAPKSGAVTAVSIVNYVLGGLSLVCGLVMMVGGAAFAAAIGGAAEQDPNISAEDAAAGAAVVGGVMVVIALIVMAMGVPMIIAGVGVAKRAKWGRILTLVLGGLAGAFGLIDLVSMNIIGLLIHGGYCGMAFGILLQKKFADEFV